jgi:hypothetical protein
LPPLPTKASTKAAVATAAVIAATMTDTATATTTALTLAVTVLSKNTFRSDLSLTTTKITNGQHQYRRFSLSGDLLQQDKAHINRIPLKEFRHHSQRDRTRRHRVSSPQPPSRRSSKTGLVSPLKNKPNSKQQKHYSKNLSRKITQNPR